MSQTLCQLHQSLPDDPNAYLALVLPPRFVCMECGRVAVKKKNLCRPKKIARLQNKTG